MLDFIYERTFIGRSENPGVPVLFGGHNLPPLVEIGLNDLPKSGGAKALQATPGTTGLTSMVHKMVTDNGLLCNASFDIYLSIDFLGSPIICSDF